MKSSVIVMLLCIVLTGCGTTGEIKGRFIGADGKGISGAEIVCWRRQINPLNLPLRVAEAKTDENGRFEVYTTKRVTSISAILWLPEKKVRRGSVTTFTGVDDEVVIEEEPNQAPEPTATLVTPRADARVAPSAAVAHL